MRNSGINGKNENLTGSVLALGPAKPQCLQWGGALGLLLCQTFLLAQLVGPTWKSVDALQELLFHCIFSLCGYFRKVPRTPESLSAPCSRHSVLSLTLCQTSAEPTFPWKASKGYSYQLAPRWVFSHLSHLKTLVLCMLYSVRPSSVRPCLAGPETRSTGTHEG